MKKRDGSERRCRPRLEPPLSNRLLLALLRGTLSAVGTLLQQEIDSVEIKETVSASEWSQRPRRARGVSPTIRRIADAVAKADQGYWVVVELTAAEKKRQPTIRNQIVTAAGQRGLAVEFEMRAGDLGVQRVR